MLKAVTRQAAKVDAKIKLLNDAAAAAAVEDGDGGGGGGGGQRQTISTANFFDHHATPEDIAVMVTEEDFLHAHRELIPSVSAGELAHYERVRATFEGGRGEGGGKEREKAGPAPLSMSGGRAVSGTLGGLRSAKGKGRVMSGKGKGKAVATGSDDGGSEDDYGAEIGADDGGEVNGRREKGKGKAVAGFQDGTASDDEGLYDE